MRKEAAKPSVLCSLRLSLTHKFCLADLAILIQVKLLNHRLPAVEEHSNQLEMGCRRAGAYNSSSSKFSPSSFATRFRLRSDILPVPSSSNSLKARRISSSGSLARIFSVTVKRIESVLRFVYTRCKPAVPTLAKSSNCICPAP